MVNTVSNKVHYRIGGWVAIFVLTLMAGEVYLRDSAPAAAALQFVRHNQTVSQEVGGLRSARLGWIGNIHYRGQEGWASFNMEVVGSRTNGTVSVMLQRETGAWTVVDARMVTDSGEVVRIKDETAQASAR